MEFVMSVVSAILKIILFNFKMINPMKSKIKLAFGCVLALCHACTPDDAELIYHPATADEVKVIELRADHKTMIPDSRSEMEFHILAYGVREQTHLLKKKEGNTSIYYEEVRMDTFIIPNDVLPNGLIKVYDENGEIMENNIFKTEDATPRQVKFYAQTGNLKSNEVCIQVRPLPEDSGDEFVFPVIFHIITPASTVSATYEVSQQRLQEEVDRLNKIFNKEATKNPNGGVAKIRFELAKYNEKGGLLEEPGKNKYQIPAASTPNGKTEYLNYINKTTALIWDPNRYMNIWVAKWSNSWVEDGTGTFYVDMPKVISPDSDPIPGLENPRVVSSFSKSDVKDISDIGILVNYVGFLDYNAYDRNNKPELATAVGTYFGLLDMTVFSYRGVTNIIDGDTDYCPDTYMYSTSGNSSIFKFSYTDDETYTDVEYYTSFNIMERYSRKNSITADQAARIRQFIENCPSRWSYKSSWALEGK